MSIKEITLAGNSILKNRAGDIQDFADPELQQLIVDLFDTMRKYNGVGIAAPQIGVSKRVFVYGFTSNPRYPTEKPIPDTIILNPEILEFSEETIERYEGCLSLPGLRGIVPRSKRIQFRANLPSGEEIRKEVEGFEARIIQHETDHLDGILFPLRVKDLNTLAMADELKRQNKL